jgi:glucose uptake protein GlcU
MLKKVVEEKYRDIASIVCFVAAGVVFFLLAGSNSFQITTNFLTNNNFASPSSTLFTPASRVLFNLEYRYLVLFLLAVIVIKLIYRSYPVGKTPKINKKLHSYLDVYLDSLSYSIFVVILSVLAGLQDISAIFFVFISSLIGTGLILFNSHDNEAEDALKSRRTGIVLSLISWLLLVIYSVSTLTYGEVRTTWYVYLLDFIGLLYLTFVIIKNNKKRFFRKLKKQDREVAQYTVNLFLKLAFLVILAVGLH